MELNDVRVGLCVTGSFCNFSKLDRSYTKSKRK